jgi:hypothetical protein
MEISMRRILLVLGFVMIALLIKTIPVQAAEKKEQSVYSGEVLCLPGVYMIDPQDCLPLGPSSYLTRMASYGITFPLTPFPATPPDPTLAELPFLYAILKEENTPIYATLEDAISGSSPINSIGPGELKYVSYIDYEETSNGRFFLLRSGGWVRVSSRVSVPKSFPGGITFQHTPKNSFGWILPLNPTLETKRTPGYENDDFTGHEIRQYELVQIYAEEKVGDTDWYLVGPDEWIEQRVVGRVVPNTTPPEGVTNGRWIEINLFEQIIAVYDQEELAYATLIASGLDPFFTRPGLFPIYKKHDTTPMSGAFEADRSDFYYLEDVPWTMYYDDARAIHGAYWRTAFGFPQSHGCVNMSPLDAHWVFNWAEEGDWVYVWDPSGNTPTEPDAYTPGGA